MLGRQGFVREKSRRSVPKKSRRMAAAEIITADNYFTFVAYFLLAFGLTFELPLVLTGLVVMGIVSPDALRTRRASILVGLWTVSCFITPGADPHSPDPRSGLHRALLRQHGPDPLRRPGIGGEAN